MNAHSITINVSTDRQTDAASRSGSAGVDRHVSRVQLGNGVESTIAFVIQVAFTNARGLLISDAYHYRMHLEDTFFFPVCVRQCVLQQ